MENVKTAFCSLAELERINNLYMEDINSVGSSGKRFYYYTQRSTAEKIMSGDPGNGIGPHFRINSLSAMNDKLECEWHSTEKSHVFALCFSNTNSESIPMWYLYSGISGEGVRIGITPAKMQEFIRDISCVYPIFSGKIDMANPLFIGEDFTLEYGWVYYLGDKYVSYRNYLYERCPEDNYDAIQEFINDNYFVKDYEWNYEKEFRIVFRFLNSPPQKIALFFDKEKLMKANGGLSAMMAPELKTLEKKVLAKELGIPEKKITKSKLKIQMDLIGRNRSSIIECFDEIIDGIDSRTDINKMEQAIYIKKQKMNDALLVSK